VDGSRGRRVRARICSDFRATADRASERGVLISEPLTTYLHDHLAGSNFAVEVLKDWCDQHAGEELADFAASLLREVEADRQVLQSVIDRAGGETSVLKEATAWAAEKVGRFKLRRSVAGEVGTFETLEALALGILGKMKLWRALAAIAATDTRLAGVDFDSLADRAEAQHAQVEQRRLKLAHMALKAGPTPS
jgi:hypothetical protein